MLTSQRGLNRRWDMVKVLRVSTLHFLIFESYAEKFLLGFGSVISPIVCQSIIATGVPWYRFYYGSLVMSGLNVVFLTITFNPTASESFRDRQKALNEGRRRKSEFLRSGRSSPVNGASDFHSSTPKLDFASKSRSGMWKKLHYCNILTLSTQLYVSRWNFLTSGRFRSSYCFIVAGIYSSFKLSGRLVNCFFLIAKRQHKDLWVAFVAVVHLHIVFSLATT